MNWWRAYHGLPYDSKLAVVAKRCLVRRGEVMAVWIACLDFASQNADRGSVQGIDAEEIACSLDFDVELVSTILDGLRNRGMISVTPCNANVTESEERITAWERRQVLRERDDDSSERVQKYRKKQATREVKGLQTETPESRHVTPSNAPEQNRTEQNRAEKNTQDVRDFEPIGPEIPRRKYPKVIEHPGAPTQESDDRFEEIWKRWPRKFGKDQAARDWISVVTPANVAEVVACAERYLASDEARRSVVKNLGSTVDRTGWLIDCARDNWESDWPKAAQPAQKKSNFDLAMEGLM